MNEELLTRKVTGEVLRAYDQIIRQWVTDTIIESGSGGGSVGIPAWVKQVAFVSSPYVCKNVDDVNTLVWPGQDFTSKTNHSSVVFFGKDSGLSLTTRKHESSDDVIDIPFSNEPAILSVRYDDLGAWIDIETFGDRYSFRSLDSAQEYFEYDGDNKTYHVDYSESFAMGNGLTEERVQEMIDASVGAAISDSY